MRSLEIHGIDDLRVVDRDDPAPGPGEVQIAVEWGGICGSDLAYWRRGVSGTAVMSHPFVLGHEVSGRVSALGAGVSGPGVGSPVTVHPARTTGPLPERLRGRENLHPDLTYLGSAAGDPHTDGAFAQTITVRADQVVPLPAGLDTRRAVLAEPLGVAMHAVTRAGDLTGAHVLVSGCGPVGLLVVLAARDAGAARISAVDLSSPARERALALGADEALESAADMSEEITVAFEASGAPASLDGILRHIARASVVVQVGNLPPTPISVTLGPIVSQELEYRGTYRFASEIEDATRLLARTPRAEQVITHVLDLEDAHAAFTTAATDPASSKVVLRLS
ncbi:L-idonate 5-dehydrogenase [Brachybacterium fresconis]|uniref:L-idonate 5-dehydrogenase n=1 Tax=Brachybacterium fresconis TaxID=173363 RepID=A0ABS4YHJ7_9MICO|nr:L-idonate 5-dehydrogenase [Brachybacterium fresconis]MBP2408239.1 L-idonate 5-dehydrogenase [Brachybacterium fresconis]